MTELILKRIGIGFVTLFFVTILVFLGTELLPGDVAQAVLGQSATPENVAALREQMGLNDPAYVRYFGWLGGMLTGDLGTSLANGAQISDLIGSRINNTLLLAGSTALIAVPLSIFLGLIRAC